MTLATEFDPQAIIDRVASLGLGLGYFERVASPEPKAAPVTTGLTAAVWADYLGPNQTGHGLDSTQGLLVLKWRTYSTLLAEPEDGIDPALLRAAHALQGALSRNFSLDILDTDGDQAAFVDLLGMSRSRLESRAGYLPQGDQTFRVMTTDIPIIIDDLWLQAPSED